MSFLRGLVGWLSGRDQRAFLDALNELRHDVAAVTVTEARQRALNHLADPTTFRCVPARSDLVLQQGIPQLPPLVSEFYSLFDQVEECRGDVRFSRATIGRSRFDARYTRIGTSTAHVDVVVREQADDVYTLDGSEAEPRYGSLGHYPTIYHFILFRGGLVDSASPTSRALDSRPSC